MDKVSYALGLSIGNNFQNSGIKDLQVEDFVQGLNDVLTEAKPALSYDAVSYTHLTLPTIA